MYNFKLNFMKKGGLLCNVAQQLKDTSQPEFLYFGQLVQYQEYTYNGNAWLRFTYKHSENFL